MAIIVVLAALVASTVTATRKGDAMAAAARQMLDDCARARQLAISQRTTVYMVFVSTNFWKDGNWAFVPPAIRSSMTVTQLYGAQWTGYAMFCVHGVGDQPGKSFARDLARVRTLPDGAFISPMKFPDGPQSAPQYQYPPAVSATPSRIQGKIDVYSFPTTSDVPFPTADMLATAVPPAFVHVPYIAFNYQGQLMGPDGNVLPYDENIPLVHGRVSYWKDQKTGLPIQPAPAQPALAAITELPPGNGTSISYNVIHIDRLTGRARLEREEVQ